MRALAIAALAAALWACLRHRETALGRTGIGSPASKPGPQPGRLVMFIGVDISGSFMDGKYFDDSIEFLARYIYAHLNGLGGMEVPHSLFVGSIGGVKKDEAEDAVPDRDVPEPLGRADRGAV